MTGYVFQPSRRRNGKRIKSRIWWAEYRLPWMAKAKRVSLEPSDKRVADQKLQALIRQAEQEFAGIVAPKPLIEAAKRPMVDHLREYIADLRARGLSRQYIVRVENR